MKLDTKKSQIIIFEPNAKNFKTIDYKLVKQADGVEKDDPIVYEKATGKGERIPCYRQAGEDDNHLFTQAEDLDDFCGGG